MEHNIGLRDKNDKIFIINNKINNLLERKYLIELDIQRVLDNPSMDRITIDKIQAEIKDINFSISALNTVKEALTN